MLGTPVVRATVAYEVMKYTSEWDDLEEGYVEEEDSTTVA